MADIPVCESFLGQHFRRWCQSAGAAQFVHLLDGALARLQRSAGAAQFKNSRVMSYAIINDLSDATAAELAAWAELGFMHVCGRDGPAREGT